MEKKDSNSTEIMDFEGLRPIGNQKAFADDTSSTRERAQSFLSSEGGLIVEDLDSSNSQIMMNESMNTSTCENLPAF